MLERNDWNRFFAFAVAIGLFAGLTASLLPQSFFYETDLYYSRYTGGQYGSRALLKIMLENMHDLAYFLGIRLFLPFSFLVIGLLKRRTVLPQLCILFGLAAVSFQAVLIFGSTGMEGWFRHQLIAFLPESCYVLAALRVYFFKQEEIITAQSAAICIFQIFLFLLCGAGLEILSV